jgi:ubiquinone/menaquinone biosynthesis C-methylase UbiE
VCWATRLYEFLRQCNASPLPKEVLDCGAGGEEPTLSLFYEFGYRTFGLEIAEEALAKAQRFCVDRAMPLKIIRGDMRRIPYANASFSFVYSFYAIFFMTKPDIAVAMSEMQRVLKPGGLLYVNFVSIDDPDNRPFCPTAPARRLLGSEGFAKHEDDEADVYFAHLRILRKEKQLLEKVHGRGRLRQAYIEYIAEKPGTAAQ